jgi:sporulation protein YlmC with PRC-barrel domain
MSQPTVGHVISASKLSGGAVKNTDGEKLGDIKEIMLDTQSGRVAYAVLSFGGFLGMGDKLFAIPWRALTPSTTSDDKLVLDISKDKLEKAPGFDKKSWPDMADHRWGLDIYRYYGEKPYWDATADKSSTKPVGSR